jgi:stearoyl-CoA desaturase (delta-9 desaturase)
MPAAPTSPGPADVERSPEDRLWAARVVTLGIVIGPFAALALAIPWWGGDLVSLRDVVIGLVMYLVTGFGITVGYHRLFTHRAFVARRGLKIALAVAGAAAVEGSIGSWVANHRRHHRFSDHRGDPHSPHIGRTGSGGRLRGLLHAHVGWLFGGAEAEAAHYCPDLLADRDLVIVDRIWPLIALGSLAIPFALGLAISGSLVGGLTTFLVAGLARMALLHHVTWSINSVCHLFGAHPFRTKDHSGNVAVLGIVSLGESFHNLHHAYPMSARHGVLPHQWDSSDRLIALFERCGWASSVRWPDASRVAALSARARHR